LFLLIRPVCRDLYTTCARMLILSSYVPLRQPEDGQYRPKHVAVHYIAIKYTSYDTVVFDWIPFSKFHTHKTGMTQFLDSQYTFQTLLSVHLALIFKWGKKLPYYCGKQAYYRYGIWYIQITSKKTSKVPEQMNLKSVPNNSSSSSVFDRHSCNIHP